MDGDEVDPAQEMLNEGTPNAPQSNVDYQKMYEAMQAQNAQLAAQNQQLAVTVQQVAARPVIQQQTANQPDPFAAFNPETAAAIRAVADNIQKDFNQKLAQTQQQFAGMALEQEAASIAAVPGLTPDQIKRAQDIFRGNRAKNIPINATECVDVVLGADFRAGKITLGNRAPPATINGGSRQPNAPAAKQSTATAKMSIKDQIKYYESMEGFDDSRVVGWQVEDD